MLNHGRVTARSLARVTGSCVSMAWAASPGKLLLRHSDRLLSDRSSWDSALELTNDVIDELQWWLNAADTWNYYEVVPKAIDIQIYTDASNIGYGGLLVIIYIYIYIYIYYMTTWYQVNGIRVFPFNPGTICDSNGYSGSKKDHIKSKTVEILTDN